MSQVVLDGKAPKWPVLGKLQGSPNMQGSPTTPLASSPLVFQPEPDQLVPSMTPIQHASHGGPGEHEAAGLPPGSHGSSFASALQSPPFLQARNLCRGSDYLQVSDPDTSSHHDACVSAFHAPNMSTARLQDMRASLASWQEMTDVLSSLDQASPLPFPASEPIWQNSNVDLLVLRTPALEDGDGSACHCFPQGPEGPGIGHARPALPAFQQYHIPAEGSQGPPCHCLPGPHQLHATASPAPLQHSQPCWTAQQHRQPFRNSGLQACGPATSLTHPLQHANSGPASQRRSPLPKSMPMLLDGSHQAHNLMMSEQGGTLHVHKYHAHPVWGSPPPAQQSGNSAAQLLQRHSWPDPEPAQSGAWDVSSANMPPCLVGSHRTDMLPLSLHHFAAGDPHQNAPGNISQADLSDDGVLMAMCTELLEGASGTGAHVLSENVADSCQTSVAAGSHQPHAVHSAAPAQPRDPSAGFPDHGRSLGQAEGGPFSAGPSSAPRSQASSATSGLSQSHAAEPIEYESLQPAPASGYGTREQYYQQCPLGRRTPLANPASPGLSLASPALPLTEKSLPCLIPGTQSPVPRDFAASRQLDSPDSPDKAHPHQLMQNQAGSSPHCSRSAKKSVVPDCTLNESSLRILAERMSTFKTSPRKRKAPSGQLCTYREPILGSTVLSMPQDRPHHPAQTPLSQSISSQPAQPDGQRLFPSSRSGQQTLLPAGRLHATSLTADTALPAALRSAACRTVSQQLRVMIQSDEQRPAAVSGPQRASRQKAAESAVDWSEYWPPNAFKRKVKAQRKAPQDPKIKPAHVPADLRARVPFFTETRSGPSSEMPMLDAPDDHMVPDKAWSIQPGHDISVPSGFPGQQACHTPQAGPAPQRTTELLLKPSSVPALYGYPGQQGQSSGMSKHQGGAEAAAQAAQQLERLLNAPRELWGSLRSWSDPLTGDQHGFGADQAICESAAAPALLPEPLTSGYAALKETYSP